MRGARWEWVSACGRARRSAPWTEKEYLPRGHEKSPRRRPLARAAKPARSAEEWSAERNLCGYVERSRVRAAFIAAAERSFGPLVRTALWAAAERSSGLRFAAAEWACRESASCDAARRGSRS